MPVKKCRLLIEKGKVTLKKDGHCSLFKQAILSLINIFRRGFFDYNVIYVYRKELNTPNNLNFASNIHSPNLKIIDAYSKIDELLKEKYDFGTSTNLLGIKEKLDSGAILFCVFIGREFSHSSWIAMTDKAKYDPVPLLIDYNRESYIQDCFTSPKYRGLGLYPYTLNQIFKFLREKNVSIVYIASRKGNFSSIKGILNAEFVLAKKLYMIKILFLKYTIGMDK